MSEFALATPKPRQAEMCGSASRDAAASLRDQIQIALAIADAAQLRSLLTESTPHVAEPHNLGTVTANVGVPLEGSEMTVDGVVRYEVIHCVLAQIVSTQGSHQIYEQSHRPVFDPLAYGPITQFRSDLKTLAQNIPLSQAIALLTHAGFDSAEVSKILHLPDQGWHKSWWYGLDDQGRFTRPFQRSFRSRHFADGTFSLQYRDFYPQEAPTCFKSNMYTIPVVIQPTHLSFRETLRLVNQARSALHSQGAILIYDHPTDLELQGYLCQGISVYGADQLQIRGETFINCADCRQQSCPLHGRANSPVEKCQAFVG